ncbi:MAG: hypothetical protein LC114_03695 [Bryobacterales bacterium]|nr:hypothetical protein [Bryobacterales bacterium]
MAYWHIELRLKSAFATPFHSGTLFGHLCWAYRDLHSDAALSEWLQGLPDHPFLISDALPAGYVPRPILSPTLNGIDAIHAKQIKRRQHVPLKLFLAARGEFSEAKIAEMLMNDPPENAARPHRTAHNRIDRITGTTPESGGLYFSDEYWPQSDEDGLSGFGFEPANDRLDVYVSTELPSQELGALFTHVGENGFGKDAALGRGRFTAVVQAPPKGLFEGGGNRWMTFSHGSLTANMLAARYRLRTHYGKLGPALANHRSPFKYPLTLLEPGSTFFSEGDGPFGDLIRNTHPDEDLRHIVHNAWHLAVPFTEALHA